MVPPTGREVAWAAGANHLVRLSTHRGLAATFQAGLDAALKLDADRDRELLTANA
jgi:hypothetical protein